VLGKSPTLCSVISVVKLIYTSSTVSATTEHQDQWDMQNSRECTSKIYVPQWSTPCHSLLFKGGKCCITTIPKCFMCSIVLQDVQCIWESSPVGPKPTHHFTNGNGVIVKLLLTFPVHWDRTLYKSLKVPTF
jgi:hypothetical protein